MRLVIIQTASKQICKNRHYRESPNNMEVKVNLITFQQACEFLNLKESRIRYLVFKRQIPFVKIGASILFDKPDLAKWIASQKVEAVYE